jgi:hypothetical protein
MHKIVTIGDSLTMGFKSGAIHDNHLAFPVFLAEALGAKSEFRHPDFCDNLGIGGIPCNLETLLNVLSARHPRGIHWYNCLAALYTVNAWLDKVEKYWESGPGSKPHATGDFCNNSAILTFGVSDACRVTEGLCVRNLARPKNNSFLFSQIPEFPMYRAARWVLNPAGTSFMGGSSQIDIARKMANDKGIENLILFLGANNCLGAIMDMELKFSDEADLYRRPHQRTSNIWLPEHFSRAYETLAYAVNTIGAEHVYVGTVPHVTIPPVSRGWGSIENGYFEYYTRPWIWDNVFDPKKDARITRDDAMLIDSFVDSYNAAIRQLAHKYHWIVVDVCAELDKMAYRRNIKKPVFAWPNEALDALRKNPVTSYLVDETGRLKLDTRYLELWDRDSPDKGKIKCGGLFSLDGVHPTTFCYGAIADMFLKSMIANGATTMSGGTPKLDWEIIVNSDSLLNAPPLMMSDLRKVLGFLSGRFTGKLLLRLLEKFKGNV